MKILIAGKNSFIGKNFMNEFHKEHKFEELNLKGYSWKEKSFTPYDVIIQLAAIVHVNSSISRKEYFEVNSDLAYDVAKKAKKEGVHKFVFFSSVKVFGEKTENNTYWNENSKCNPSTFYGQSKLDAENRLLELADENFIVSIIRPCLVYGPGVKANMFNLIKLIDKIPILPFGNTNNLRSFIYIKNLLDLLNSVVKSSSGHLVVASDSRAISTTELSRIIASNLGKRRVFILLPNYIVGKIKKLKSNLLSALWGSFIVDSQVGFDHLNFKPKYSVEQGISDMVNWYKNIYW